VDAVMTEAVSPLFSLFNRELTGKIFIFSPKIEFSRPQPPENTAFYTKFPKKLTGKFIWVTGNFSLVSGKLHELK